MSRYYLDDNDDDDDDNERESDHKTRETKRLFSQAALDMVPCLFKTPPEQKPGS